MAALDDGKGLVCSFRQHHQNKAIQLSSQPSKSLT